MMRQSIVLERNFQIEEAPAGKRAIGPLPVKMQCPDTVPFVPAVQDRPQTPAKPTHRLPEDLTAIASTEVVEPPLQYGLHFGADCFHRSRAQALTLFPQLPSQRRHALLARPSLSALVVPASEVEACIQMGD